MARRCIFCLSPGHPLAEKHVSDKDELEKVRAHYGKVDEKIGLFTGKYCINPMTNEKIPLYIANFVLMEYGTGAIMSVPAHDQRDFEFAEKYGLLIREVIIRNPEEKRQKTELEEAYEDEGILVDSGQFSGLNSTEAKQKIADYLEEKGLGKKVINYKLRDWGISNHRIGKVCPKTGVRTLRRPPPCLSGTLHHFRVPLKFIRRIGCNFLNMSYDRF